MRLDSSMDTLITRQIDLAYRDFIKEMRFAPNILTIHPKSWDELREDLIMTMFVPNDRMRPQQFHGMNIYVSSDVDTFRVSYAIPK